MSGPGTGDVATEIGKTINPVLAEEKRKNTELELDLAAERAKNVPLVLALKTEQNKNERQAKSISDLSVANTDLKGELQAIAEQNERLRAELAQLKKDSADANTIIELRRRLANSLEEKELLLSHQEDIQKELVIAVEREKTATQKFEAVREDLATHERKGAELEAGMQQCKRELDAARKEAAQNEKTTAEWKSAFEESREENAQLRCVNTNIQAIVSNREAATMAAIMATQVEPYQRSVLTGTRAAVTLDRAWIYALTRGGDATQRTNLRTRLAALARARNGRPLEAIGAAVRAHADECAAATPPAQMRAYVSALALLGAGVDDPPADVLAAPPFDLGRDQIGARLGADTLRTVVLSDRAEAEIPDRV